MERNLTVSAVVLRSRRWGDLHRMVTLACAELGIIDALAYGARKGKLAGRIDLFLVGVFFLYHNPVRGDYTIVDVDPKVGSEHIRADLRWMYIASFMAELVLKMHGGDSQVLFDLVSRSFALLDTQETGTADTILIQFIWRLIEITGLAPDLVACPLCEKPYGAEEALSFNTAMHAPCCAACADVDVTNGEMGLGPGARRYLLYTAGMVLDDAVGVQLSATATDRIRIYMLRYASIIAGGALKTLGGSLL
jgi:DNA repair protein RecO (recombination protein O)